MTVFSVHESDTHAKPQWRVYMLSRVRLFATPWTAARQAPLSVGFSRQEYWDGLPFSSPGHLPNPGVKPASPALAGGFFAAEPPAKPRRNLRKSEMKPKF